MDIEYAVSGKTAGTVKVDCLIVPLEKGARQVPESLPEETRKLVAALVKNGDFAGERGQTQMLPSPAGLAAKRLLLVGTGGKGPMTAPAYVRLVNLAARTVAGTGSASVGWLTHGVAVDDRGEEWLVRETSRVVAETTYRFDEYRSQKPPKRKLKKWFFLVDRKTKALERAAAEGAAVGAGVNMARDLGNQPPNVATPRYLADQARKMARQYEKLSVKVITEKQAEKLGMGAFCAVSRGSAQEGQIIIFEYKGKSGKPVSLVGKGVTFDTGGISLKPGAAMDEMKFDMCGAASVFGSVKAVCEMDLPIHLVGAVAAAENMPDGNACRPGDIVKTYSGQTVEILNTDAEGRLVLSDTLTYVQEKYKPHTLIDMATLTGACVIALGAHAAAVYSKDEELSKALLDAGEYTGDRGWPMPLWDEYQEQLKSPFADMANIGGPKAGSITAACFLSRFVNDTSKWAHLDIAGVAWLQGENKGATGRPVPLLTRYLMNLAGRKAS